MFQKNKLSFVDYSNSCWNACELSDEGYRNFQYLDTTHSLILWVLCDHGYGEIILN